MIKTQCWVPFLCAVCAMQGEVLGSHYRGGSMSATIDGHGLVTITAETLWNKSPVEGAACESDADCKRCLFGSNPEAPCPMGTECLDGGVCIPWSVCVSGACAAVAGTFPLSGISRNALVEGFFPSGFQILDRTTRAMLRSTSVFGGTLPSPDIEGTTMSVDRSDSNFDVRRQQFTFDLPGLGLAQGHYIFYWVDVGRIDGIHNVSSDVLRPLPSSESPYSLEVCILFDGLPHSTPIINSLRNTTVAKGELYSNHLNASGDSTLTYTFLSGSDAPRYGWTTQIPGITLDSSGRVEIPSASTATLDEFNFAGEPAGDYIFKIEIRDQDDMYVEQDMLLDVISTPNRTCTITASSMNPTVSVGDTLVLTLTTSDPDPLNSLSISDFPGLANSTLTQVGVNAVTATYLFSPDAAQSAAVLGVNFTAVDDDVNPLSCVANVQITVLPLICGDDMVNLPGEECDGLSDAACPGECLTDCTCGSFCGDGACDLGENSCNCLDDCRTPPSNEVLDSTCDDGLDNDCDGLIDTADPDCTTIPAASSWGLIVTVLLLLSAAKIAFRRKAGVSGSLSG